MTVGKYPFRMESYRSTVFMETVKDVWRGKGHVAPVLSILFRSLVPWKFNS